MPRRAFTEADGLEPLERQVVALHIGGASADVISYMIEKSPGFVSQVLQRPVVARYVMKLTALIGGELAPAIKNLSEAMDEAAERAFQVECEAMERLFELDDPEDKKFVQAQLGSATIAQDILDRAGKRAPTRIQQKVEYSIAPQTVEHLARIMGEHDQSTIDITPESEGASPPSLLSESEDG